MIELSHDHTRHVHPVQNSPKPLAIEEGPEGREDALGGLQPLLLQLTDEGAHSLQQGITGGLGQDGRAQVLPTCLTATTGTEATGQFEEVKAWVRLLG